MPQTPIPNTGDSRALLVMHANGEGEPSRHSSSSSPPDAFDYKVSSLLPKRILRLQDIRSNVKCQERLVAESTELAKVRIELT